MEVLASSQVIVKKRWGGSHDILNIFNWLNRFIARYQAESMDHAMAFAGSGQQERT